MKKTIVFLLITLLLFPLSAFADAKDTYAEAEELLAQRKYSEAAQLLDSISTYGDASKLAMYCKACALCDAGMYDLGLVAFETLGDFKDSPMRLTYYIARGIEETNSPTDWESMETAVFKYSTIPVFLDSFERIIALNERIETLKTAEYNSAIALKDAGKYNEAIEAFKKIYSYKDSAEQIKACETRILDMNYEAAVALMNEGKYSEAIIAFTALQNHRDSHEKIYACRYDAAVALMTTGRYSEAITAFTEIIDYKDSSAKIKECEKAILDEKYDAAVALMNAGKYSEAITVFSAIENHRDSRAQIQACEIGKKYDATIALMNQEKYYEAYQAFVGFKEYKDSAQWATECLEQILQKAMVGTYIPFGTYEQDNNYFNGMEIIEWKVLAREKNRLLVISKHALDCKPYNESQEAVTWESCTLRKWLNLEFLNSAFTSKEQAMIPTVTVSADVHERFDTNQGNSTEDQVFLLSRLEADKYFAADNQRMCKPTVYAIKQGATNSDCCLWWTRTLGENQEYANYVGIYGNCRGDSGGYGVKSSRPIRPALWISIDVSSESISIPVAEPTSPHTPTSTPNPTPTATPEPTYKPLKQGDKGDDVLTMKKRLQELGYFSAGAELSDQYNSTVAERVKQFQKVNKLKQTGVADEETLKLLFSDQAKKKPK